MSGCSETSGICRNNNPENLEIFVKRIVAKWDPPGGEQIFFNVENGKKIPVDLCVHNFPGYGNGLPVNCIFCERLIVKDTKQDIICTSKSRIKVFFKILLVAEFEDDRFDTITLPDDIGTKVCYGPGVQFPIHFGNNETLDETTLPGTSENVYVWTKDVPFTDPNWVGQIPRSLFSNPTLSSEIVVKCAKVLFDVDGDCECEDSGSPIPGTLVHVSVVADVVDKVGINEDICINGTLLDNCEL